MTLLKEMLFYNPLRTELRVPIKNEILLNQVTNIMMNGTTLRNIIYLIQEQLYNNDQVDKQTEIQILVLLAFQILLIIIYRLLSNKRSEEDTKTMNFIFLMIYFVFQLWLYYPSVSAIKENNLLQNHSYYFGFNAFWLGFDVMIWITLMFILTNLFLKIFLLSIIFTIISILTFDKTSSVLSMLQTIIMIITYITTSSFILRSCKNTLSHLTNLIEEGDIYKKILETLPESIVIIDNKDMDPLYYNNSFKSMVNSNIPQKEDFQNFISKITNLKVRGGSGAWLGNLCNACEESHEECSLVDNIAKFLGSSETIKNMRENSYNDDDSKFKSSPFEIGNTYSAIFIGNRSILPLEKNQSLKSPPSRFLSKSMNNKDVDFKENINQRIISQLSQRNDSEKKIIDLESDINGMQEHDSFKNSLNLQKDHFTVKKSNLNSITTVNLNIVIEMIIDMMHTKEKDDKNACVILQGKLDNQDFEIKLIKLFYNNKSSLLVFVTDMTYNNIKTKIEDNKEYKSLLLSSFSHELKTPLNGSLGMIQSSLEDEATPIATRKNFLLPALKSLKVLLFIINDILDYSQILTNKLRLDFKGLNIKMLIYETIDLMEIHVKKKENVKLTVDIDNSIPNIFYTDPARLTQILLCLLGNAYKFTFKGEIKIKIRYICDTNCIKISIKDTGVGMNFDSLMKLKKLFELSGPDYIHKKLSKNSTGCALGLSIASILSKYLGPSIEDIPSLTVKSIANRGSRFTLMLENKKEGSCNFMIKKDGIELYDQSTKKMAKKRVGESRNTVLHLQTKFFIEKKTTKNIAAEMESDATNSPTIPKISTMPIINLQTPTINQIQSMNIIYEEQKETNAGNNSVTNISNTSVESNGIGKVFDENYIKNNSNQFKFFQPLESNRTINNPSNSTKNPVILIVDDDSFNIHSIEMMLKSLNIKYETAYNGHVAIDKIIKNNMISFVFMDCNMPLMDGWEATKILRDMMKKGEINNFPIIAATAYCDEQNKMKCFESGMNEILEKPIMKEELVKILKFYNQI